MKKITQTVLMLCLFLSAAFCYAHGVARTGIPQKEKGEGTPIDISTETGTSVDYNSIHTPNGVNFYIPNTGSYVVTFTLPNNDVYYGEFEVTSLCIGTR